MYCIHSKSSSHLVLSKFFIFEALELDLTRQMTVTIIWSFQMKKLSVDETLKHFY